jgi:hypothetical protein
MSPDEELGALWYHLEDMCSVVAPPKCYLCSGVTELVPPEMLYYVCRVCFPASFEWRPVEDL